MQDAKSVYTWKRLLVTDAETDETTLFYIVFLSCSRTHILCKDYITERVPRAFPPTWDAPDTGRRSRQAYVVGSSCSAETRNTARQSSRYPHSQTCLRTRSRCQDWTSQAKEHTVSYGLLQSTRSFHLALFSSLSRSGPSGFPPLGIRCAVPLNLPGL